MESKPLSIEQQKDYIRRYIEGCEMASRLQDDQVRARTDEEKWAAANRLLADWEHAPRRRTATSGLVEQQRYFMKAHRR